MLTRQKQRFIYAQATWMLATIFWLLLIDFVSLALFFVISFVGYLALVDLTESLAVVPHWRRRLRWISWFGVIAFCALATSELLATLQS